MRRLRGRIGPETILAAVTLVGLFVIALVRGEPPAGDGLDTYGSDDFRSGGYAAFAELLRREGARVTRFDRHPIALDRSVATLISALPLAGSRSPADAGALAAWVRDGGRLVLVGRDTPNAALFKARLHQPGFANKPKNGGALAGPFAARVRSLSPRGDDRFLVGRRDRGEIVLRDRGGVLAVRERVGRGSVTFVSEPRTFRNSAIAAADNARYAVLLVLPASGTVAFDESVRGDLTDRTWWEVLALPLRVVIVFLAIAIGLVLIGGVLRLGPPIAANPPREPTSAEFVAALAALWERANTRRHAVDALGETAFGSVARTLGLPERTPLETIVARSAQHRGGAAVAALASLVRRTELGDADVIASAALAHTIREDFTHGGNGNRRRSAFAGGARARRRGE